MTWDPRPAREQQRAWAAASASPRHPRQCPRLLVGQVQPPAALPPPGQPRGLAGVRAAPSTPASPAAGRGAKPAAGRRLLCSASLRALRRG